MKPEQENYINQINEDILKLCESFEELQKTITWGKVGYSLYSDFFERLKFQLRSIINITNMVQSGFYKESFASLRPVLEYYLVYTLMTKSKKYFELYKKKRGENIHDAVARMNKGIQGAKKEKATNVVKAIRYKRTDDLVAVIIEGPFVDGKKSNRNRVPYHHFLFEKFYPNQAILDEKDYFNYRSAKYSRQFNARSRQNQIEQKWLKQHYMSFEAILYNLQLNRLLTKQSKLRVEAHYLFLGKFIHPNNGMIGMLKTDNSDYTHKPLSDFLEPNFNLSLLGMLYSGYILSNLIDTILYVLTNAPKLYIKKVNDEQIRNLLDKFYKDYDYFWFIHNKPHDYDKFQQCVAGIGKKKAPSDFRLIMDKDVKFDQDILNRIQRLQLTQSSTICGTYTRPKFEA